MIQPKLCNTAKLQVWALATVELSVVYTITDLKDPIKRFTVRTVRVSRLKGHLEACEDDPVVEAGTCGLKDFMAGGTPKQAEHGRKNQHLALRCFGTSNGRVWFAQATVRNGNTPTLAQALTDIAGMDRSGGILWWSDGSRKALLKKCNSQSTLKKYNANGRSNSYLSEKTHIYISYIIYLILYIYYIISIIYIILYIIYIIYTIYYILNNIYIYYIIYNIYNRIYKYIYT